LKMKYKKNLRTIRNLQEDIIDIKERYSRCLTCYIKLSSEVEILRKTFEVREMKEVGTPSIEGNAPAL